MPIRPDIETLGPEAYDRMSYYERWMSAISATLIQRGVLTIDELGRRMEEVAARKEEP